MEDRRQSIIRAAKQLFAEKGYAATGLREIAEKAGVSLGNIYNYFKSKEEIFCSIFTPEQIGANLKETFENLASDFPFNIAELLLSMKRTVDQNIELYRLYYIDLIEFGGKNTNAMFEYFLSLGKGIFRKYIDKRVKEGMLRNFDYDFLAKHFLVSMISFFSSMHTIPAMKVENYSEEEMVEMIGEVLLRGIVKE
ncbi:MAG: TetR/AcrR family transcriptional regulator [Spirochaetes bacterium]|nr:TetR/AcrR family transcriptional regulator [Spirochaetota bacterium]